MFDAIEYIKIQEDPEIKIRTLRLPCTNENYTHNNNILFIPGWASQIETYEDLLQALQYYGNITVYEPKGFGKSFAPRRRGIFSIEAYNEEIATILNILNYENGQYVFYGSCTGSAMVFNYFLDGKGPKPMAIVANSPQVKYNTPFWYKWLSKIPDIFMAGFQKIAVFLVKSYVRLFKPAEMANVKRAEKQLKENDAFGQRRFTLEYIAYYNIKERLQELTVPILSFIGEEDFFTNPEKSKQFLIHPQSEVIQLQAKLHRAHKGNEEKIASEIGRFLEKIRD